MASVAEAQQSTQTALAEAIAERRFPPKAAERAAKLLNRLETPTRVTVLGLPKSGKTGVFNLLAGEAVLPEGMPATVQMIHGDAPKATVTVKDGSKLTLEGPHDMQRIASLAPVFIQLEHNLAALKKISLLEVVTSYDRVEQIQAIKWAMKQTDIAIWCTDDFGASEQALWMDAPDAMKDHAILLRTRADALGSARSQAVQQLERQAGNEFAFFFAVSAHEAYAARANPGGVDKARLKASGAMSLISTILRQIERGRQYSVDQAEILLHQHANSEPQPEMPKPPVLEVPAEAAPAKPPVLETSDPEPVKPPVLDEPAPEPEPVKPPVLEAPAPEPKPAPETAEVEVPDETTAPAEAGMSDDIRSVFQTALSLLEDTGAKLAEIDASEPAEVINISARSVSRLSDQMEEADLPETADVVQFRDMAIDASDLMQLLKIEGDEISALDAVSAMLQLKRGLQAKLAA